MKIGLFFGTFNPIHIGHMILANHLAEYSNLDEVWLVITPLSPFKQKKAMLANHHRLALANIAVEGFDKLKTSDIEFKLPQPNYTINTLAYIEEKYPKYKFSLIMGEDNLKSFHKWKNYQTILENYTLYVYPRISKQTVNPLIKNHKNIINIKAPIIEISSTFIRQAIKDKKEVRTLLPPKVWKYIEEMNFYKK